MNYLFLMQKEKNICISNVKGNPYYFKNKFFLARIYSYFKMDSHLYQKYILGAYLSSVLF